MPEAIARGGVPSVTVCSTCGKMIKVGGCPHCGAENKAVNPAKTFMDELKAAACPHCGALHQAKNKFCINCHKQINP